MHPDEHEQVARLQLLSRHAGGGEWEKSVRAGPGGALLFLPPTATHMSAHVAHHVTRMADPGLKVSFTSRSGEQQQFAAIHQNCIAHHAEQARAGQEPGGDGVPRKLLVALRKLTDRATSTSGVRTR